MKRFMSKVQKSETCWNWVASTHRYGYGRFRYKGKGILAHRASWEIHNGEIPNGLWVLHKCDNPLCVNPDHLFLGTRFDNTRDMMEKGRQARGSRVKGAKLTEGDIPTIVNLARHKSQKWLADSFGVSASAISMILAGKRWVYITHRGEK